LANSLHASPIDDSVLVKVFQSQQHFCAVKFGLSRRELLPLNVQHQISAWHKLHAEVDARLGLEAGVQAEQERMPFLGGCQEDTLFGLCAVMP
jgi:hypothetical protein